MNKKAIIFTIDALVALAIFVAVTIAIYSVLTPNPGMSVQNSAVYTNSENFLRASDRAENLSQAFEKLQLGNVQDAEAVIQGILGELPYPAEMRLNVYEGGILVNSLTVNAQDFETSIIVRKFLVLSLTEDIGQAASPRMVPMTVQSAQGGGLLTSEYTTINPESEEYHYAVTTTVRNSEGADMMWSIDVPQPEEFNLLPGQSTVRTLHVVVPPDAVIGEYEMRLDLQADRVPPGPPPIMEQAHTNFNIIRYGIAELEVGTS